MRHKLSVAGTMPRESIPVLHGIEVEDEKDGITFTTDSSEKMDALKRLLAFSLTDVITGEYERKSLSDFLDINHPYLLPEERRHILQNASLSMQKTAPEERNRYIEEKLYRFLTESEVLSIEGFVNFRLKEYKKKVQKTAEEATQVYLAEKEYEEFITLLKYFVYMQPPQMPLLHVVMKSDGSFRLLDAEKEDVTTECCREFRFEKSGVLTNDDLLISVLITLSPRELVIHNMHNFQNPKVPETIFKVFGGRIRFCEMCPLCKHA